MSFATPFNALPILGAIFFAAFFTLSTKLPIRTSKSALSSAKPVIRLLHDAFMEEIEPLIVKEASLAVVPSNSNASSCVIAPLATSSLYSSIVMPEIPISVCITWIASTMFAKDILFLSTESLNSEASLIKRCISVFVPPYPSLRLSNMV